MKLSMEIKNQNFIYSYEIGENEKYNHTTKLDSTNLLLFCDALKYASETLNRKMDAENKEMHIDILVNKKLKQMHDK